MRNLKIVLLAAGIIILTVTLGFFLQLTWATRLWPLPDGRLSYNFIAAILAGSAVPLIWIALSEEWGAFFNYGLSFGLLYGGIGIYAFLLFARDSHIALLAFGSIIIIIAVCHFMGAAWGRNQPLKDRRPMPSLLRWAFVTELAVLILVGIALLQRTPNTLPWPLSQESSVMYGWVFVSLALYYLYPVLNPKWSHAKGPLLGFLAYDLVLIGPLLARFTNLNPEFQLGQITAVAIITVSAALGIYYLFINKGTRLSLQSQV